MLLFPAGCTSLPCYYFGDPFLVIRVCISLGPDPFCANQTKNVTSGTCFGGYHPFVSWCVSWNFHRFCYRDTVCVCDCFGLVLTHVYSSSWRATECFLGTFRWLIFGSSFSVPFLSSALTCLWIPGLWMRLFELPQRSNSCACKTTAELCVKVRKNIVSFFWCFGLRYWTCFEQTFCFAFFHIKNDNHSFMRPRKSQSNLPVMKSVSWF